MEEVLWEVGCLRVRQHSLDAGRVWSSPAQWLAALVIKGQSTHTMVARHCKALT